MYKDIKNRIFDISINTITVILVLACLVPMLHIAAVSFSSNAAILSRRVTIWPVGFNVEAYRGVLSDQSMIRSLFFTVRLTLTYTVISMFMTVLAAYPLTKKNLKGRSVFLIMIIITMYFSGGMIPDYMLIRDLKLIDNFWALVLPGMLSAFNMIILKTFFSNLPPSLEESAFLDGASHLTILLRIVLPLSTPVLATLSLFYAVGRWNGFMDSLFYITSSRLYPLQLKLYQIVYNNMQLEIAQVEGNMSNLLAESLKSASVMFATIPILLVYPWLQKYFISGIMIGAIKG